ncbi:MAG: Holliday junction resolvase RuvX [Mycoplasmoidaceae bacterium]
MNILGIDYGIKKIGLAICLLGITMPYEKIINTNTSNVIEKISKIIIEEKISKIVIGIPLNNFNKDTETSLLVRGFSDELKKHFDNIEIILFDEKYSTKESINLLKNACYKNSKIKDQKDSLSAVNILNRYLGINNGS